MSKSNNYNADSITELTPRESVRTRPGMYIGNINSNGYHHLFYEILSNSIDEAINGYGDKIIIRLLEKNVIEIEDFGRGIPFGKNSNGKEVLHMNFTTLHAGGKMDNTKDNTAYKTSGGLNGVGVSITNFLSTYLKVISIRENETATLEFIDGESKNGTKIEKKKSKRTGTIIRFSPDLSIFNNVKGFSPDYIISRVKDQVYLEKITIIFEDQVNDETYTFTNKEGISKYISDYNQTMNETEDDDDNEETKISPITSIIVGEGLKGTGNKGQEVGIDFALQFVSQSTKSIKGYTNSIANPDGGTHILGFNNGVFKGVKNILEYQGQAGEKLLKDIHKDDINNIIGIINVQMPDPMLEGQTKNKLTNSYISKLVETNVSKILEKSMTQKDIANIMKSIEARIAFRKKIKKDELKLEIATSDKDLQSKLPSKLTDALAKDRSQTELFIVEGDSAGGGIKKERNPQKHAIMPLRGKMLNVLATTNEKAGKNQEVNNLIYALSGGRIYDNFDIDKHLRYGKIIILGDADPDGKHIANLVIGFFVKYYFEVIEKGRLYICNPPLFSASKKDDVKYFFSDVDKDKFLNSKEGKGYKISRFKGLGEMDEDELAAISLNTRTRSLHKVTVEDATEAKSYIKELMSTNKAKAELVKEYQQTYIDKVENDEMGLEDKTKEIVDVVKDNSIEYALEVNQDRSIPYIEDGLKNVNRRTIYALDKSFNSKSNGDFIKSATIVGNVIGYYHPHGDMSVYEAMVMMIQDFRQHHQLVLGHGSYGSIFAPTGFGAHRYTKAKISEFSEDVLIENLSKKPVPFTPNFANTLEEPVVLPSKLPMALLTGDSGIGFGMSHSSLPHNIREVIAATIAYLKKRKNEKFDATKYIKGPDIPQGGYILNTPQEIREIYNSEKGGSFTFRVPIESTTFKKKKGLLITSVPYRTFNTEDLISKLKDLLLNNELYGIKNIVDISGGDKSKAKSQKGLKIFLEIDTKLDKTMIIEDLYKNVRYSKSGLEYTISYRPLYVDRNKGIKSYSLNSIISTFVAFRKETVINILTYDVEKLVKDITRLNNKKLFALNIDKILKIIKNNNTRKQIKSKIIEAFPKYNLTDEDAESIITTELINVKDLKVLESKLKELEREKKKLEAIINSPTKLNNYIIAELEELQKKYNGSTRKTKFLPQKALKSIMETKDKYAKMIKKMKEQEKIKPNYIYIDSLGFLFRDFAVNESTVEGRLEKFQKEKKKNDNPIFVNINENIGTLFVLSSDNLGYYIHLDKMSLKQERSAVNRLIKGFKGEPIAAFIHDKEDPKKYKKEFIVLYKDNKQNIGGFRISSDNIAKTRQGFSLFGKGKELISIIDDENFDIGKVEGIKLDEYNNVRKTEYNIKDLPVKKSFSSGKTLLKRKK